VIVYRRGYNAGLYHSSYVNRIITALAITYNCRYKTKRPWNGTTKQNLLRPEPGDRAVCDGVLGTSPTWKTDALLGFGNRAELWWWEVSKSTGFCPFGRP
jgi:hypothetical protein